MGYRHRATQYPNGKIITLHNGEVVSDEDDDDDLSDMPLLEDASDEEEESAPQGLIYTLVTRCALNM